MKAVVMAGGEGSRLRPLTVNTPKPLAPVCNIPVMEHMIGRLVRHNIKEIIVTLHYLADEIVSYFGNGKEFGVNINYSIEEEPLGTAGSIKKIASSLDDSFLIISGDAITDFDFSAFIQFHKTKRSKASVILKKVENPLEFGIVITDSDSVIRKFIEKPDWGEVITDTVNTGIYCLEPEILDLMENGAVYDFSKDIFPMMMKKGEPLYGCVLDGYWCDIGSLEQYRLASCDLFQGKIDVDIPGKLVRKNIWIGDNSYVHPSVKLSEYVVIGKNCKISEGVHIGSYASIGDNCIISKGAQIERSIIWGNTYIGRDCVVNGTIIGKGAVLKEKVRTHDGAIIGDRCFIGQAANVHSNIKIWPDKKIEAGAVVSLSLIWGGRWLGSMFGNDGISGLSNIEITPEFALKLGAAFGSFFEKGNTINTSRDEHPASRMINRAIICGLTSTGIQVADLRVVPAAVARKVTSAGAAEGGVHVRMKPYDPQSVFIEFFNNQGINISKSEERKLENLFSREDFRRCPSGEIGVIGFPPRVIDNYTDGFLKCLDIGKISSSSFKAVIDYGFSSSSAVFPNILGKLGCETISINSYIDPHREGVYSKRSQLSQLSKVVVTLGANAGVYLDSDSESFFLIDEQGRLVNGNRLLLLMTYFISKAYPLPAVAVTESAPSVIDKMMWDAKGEVVRTGVGRQSLMEAALDKTIIFAGNHKGGFIFPEFNCGFDSMFAFAKLLELMALTKMSIGEAADNLPVFYQAKADVECAFSDKGRLMRYFHSYCETHPYSAIDGIKIFFAGSWGLVVPDKTEPVLHLTSEAKSQEQANSVIEHLKQNIKIYKSEEAAKRSALKLRKCEYAENIFNCSSQKKKLAAKRFYFCIPGEYTGMSAQSLDEFLEIIDKAPSASFEYHFRRRDFEEWLRTSLCLEDAADRIKNARLKGVKSGEIKSLITGILKDFV